MKIAGWELPGSEKQANPAFDSGMTGRLRRPSFTINARSGVRCTSFTFPDS